jgi:2-polyprenyl-3-methyl-5-hydroxy-6-metoxy-1,4-benzoquinol methylase
MMKYDADFEPEWDNNSHALVLDLVGRDKAVLDVGCSTGALGKALSERGCTVTGVEVDPEAADHARSHLAEVLVADLDDVELGSLPFDRDFDVIVFADVLEHLKDPVRALRSSASLLRPGGYAVISIPNVAHASVRLALLDGRFDYQDLGLLDETHIRFFTRQTLRGLLASSGFAAVDMRRTVAGPFATEIRVNPTDVPGDVSRELDLDEDASTYQFVFAAVPIGVGGEEIAEVLRETDERMFSLRRQLAEIVRAADLGPIAPTIGVLATSSSPREILRRSVLESELRRRLDGFRFRPISRSELELFAGSGDATFADLPFELDAIVVAGQLEASTGKLLRRLESTGVNVLLFGAVIEAPSPALEGFRGALVGSPFPQARGLGRWLPVPELTIVSDRLFDPELVGQRTRLLRLLGSLPAEGGQLFAAFRDVSSGRGRAPVRNLLGLATQLDLCAVVMDLPADWETGDRYWRFAGTEAVDIVAAVGAAELVISDDLVVLALGLALGRPTVGLGSAASGPEADLSAWFGETDLFVPGLSAVEAVLPIARARAADYDARGKVQARLNEPFDRLAAELVDTAGRRAPVTVPARLRDLLDQLAVLQAANAGLTRRQRAERVAFGARAERLLHVEEDLRQVEHDLRQVQHQLRQVERERQDLWNEGERLIEGLAESERIAGERQLTLQEVQRDLDLLRAQNVQLAGDLDHSQHELNALLSTRTFRTLRPARRVYGRLRSVLR